MYTVLTISENLHLEVANSLCSLFSNTRLNDDQNLWTMPTMQFASMVLKSYITSTLEIPSYHLHGGRVGVEVVIGDPLGPRSAYYRLSIALMSLSLSLSCILALALLALPNA